IHGRPLCWNRNTWILSIRKDQVSYIKRGRDYGENKVAIGRAADRRGGVVLKGATDEKVSLNCSGRCRACDAGTGGRHEGQGTGSAGGAAKPVGRCVRRGLTSD